MLKVAVKGLASRRLRAVLTALSIVLGVALVAGTYVLTDSLHSDLGSVYQTIYKNTAASITGRNAIDTGANAANGGSVPTFSQSLLARVGGCRESLRRPVASPARRSSCSAARPSRSARARRSATASTRPPRS